MEGLLGRLKQRKLVQWTLAYLAAAFALLQGFDIVAQQFGGSEHLRRGVTIALAVGFFVALVLAWYHGERGAQRVTGTEILILALLLAIGGGLLWRFAHVAASAAAPASEGSRLPVDAKSVAVLPFVNMSGDPKQDYFSDGITEEILDALAKASDLKVAARTSAFAFKGKAEDLRAIGEVLGVATVLEGSVQTIGDDVRITAQLIDARSGFHLWSDHYDRKLTSVFAVEDEISAAIATKLQARLGSRDGRVGAGDVRAHELYLRGLTLLAARGTGLRDAADAFRQAVTIDPDYAQAWAALAQAAVLVHNWHFDSTGTAMHEADEAVARALELDPTVATAHVALGIIHDERWEWADAEREFRRALELAPNDAEAIEQYAQFLHEVGRLDAALPLIERANRIDPLSGLIGGVHAQVLKDLHRCEASKAQVERALGVAPDSRYARGVALNLALDCRDYAEAETQATRFAALAGRDPATYAALVRGVADASQRDGALRLLQNLDALGIDIARWRLLLGDRNGALAELETWFGGQPANGVFQLWDPVFDAVRDDPRFKAVLAHIGVPLRTQPA